MNDVDGKEVIKGEYKHLTDSGKVCCFGLIKKLNFFFIYIY